MSAITTHILDVSLGRPARGVKVVLSARSATGEWQELAQGTTDADGRVRDLLAGESSLAAGVFRLWFDVAAYHERLGVTSFYPEVSVSFHVNDTSAHYHVPLLLSPFGYSTYRGS
jgi:5-hydroxyisourate hydrolase